MSLRKLGISVAITAAVLSTVTLIGSSPASAHRRGGHQHHGHSQPSNPGKQICYGVPPHYRCVPVTSR